MHTESLTRIFLTFSFFSMQREFKRICKRDRLRLLSRMKKRSSAAEGKANEKNFFLFFYPHTLTFRLKRPIYRGFKGEGKCEGKLSTLTLTLTQKSVLNPICPAKVQSKEESNENQKEKRHCKDFRIIVPEKCSCLVPRVQLSGTKSSA